MPKTKPFEENVDRYESWFLKYPEAYAAELRAVKELLPKKGAGLEVGVGTGKFATPFGIQWGIDPSINMGRRAMRNGTQVVSAVAEHLPLKKGALDYILMVTTICFLDDIRQASREIYRAIKESGVFIVGFVDRLSPLGKIYEANKTKNVFYREASFYSADEISNIMQESGFKDIEFRQTLFIDNLSQVKKNEPVSSGYGKGSFVVARCSKK